MSNEIKPWVCTNQAIHSRAILVPVTPECRLKKFIYETWTGILANGAYQDQMPQNAASDQVLHYLLKSQEIKS